MSGTRSPLKTEHPTERHGLWRLGLLLFPFTTAAVAINLFLLGLIGHRIGLPAISPVNALLWSLPLGFPATWAAAIWVRGLIDEAEGRR